MRPLTCGLQEGSDESTLFPVIAASLKALDPEQEERILLLATMAPEVPATQEMLANLWNMVRISLSKIHAMIPSPV